MAALWPAKNEAALKEENPPGWGGGGGAGSCSAMAERSYAERFDWARKLP